MAAPTGGPDGKRFLSDECPWNKKEGFISCMSKQNGQYRLFTISPDGGSALRLFPGETLAESYHSWSPGGEWLDGEGNYNIYLKDRKGKTSIRLTKSDKLEQAPVFVLK